MKTLLFALLLAATLALASGSVALAGQPDPGMNPCQHKLVHDPFWDPNKGPCGVPFDP